MATKITSIVCWSLFRVLLPLTLLAAAVFRYNALSFMYLVCLLITPLLPYPTVTSMTGCTGRFLKAMVGLSALPVLAHIIFHITLVAVATDSEPYGSMFPNCSNNEMIARQFGLQRLDDVPYYHGIRLILPDVAVLAVSIVVLVVSIVLIRRDSLQETDLPLTSGSNQRKRKVASALNYLGEFFVGLLLAASSIMVPSVLSSLYLLVFLVLCILWACYHTLGHCFARFRIILLVYTGAHILLLHLYQFQFFQDAVPKDDLAARLLGLTGVIRTDCSKVYAVEFHPNLRWMVFVNPGVLLLLYWVMALETRYWFKTKDLTREEVMAGMEKKRQRRRKRPSNTERQRLVDEEVNLNYNSMDQGGGASELEAGPSDGKAESDKEDGERYRKDSKRAPLVSIFMFAMKQSYVLMLIAMMAWSIMYLSWLTFVLLLGACILWMLPNSRRASLVTSPLLVLYVVCYLLAQYVFNMDLKAELPTMAGTMPVREIGLMRFDTAPKDLAIQIFFAMFFLMSLRQFMRERRPASEQPTGFPMYSRTDDAPIEGFTDLINLGFPDSADGYDSATIRVFGRLVMEVLSKYWIFVCAGMLLLIAVQEVVIYRIIYMVLFLLFVICFQVSYPLWRGLMFAFWWLVIVYSMGVLIIIYTYQFEQFPGYWQNNTGWDNTTLADIGLEKFEGTELFIKLLTPTSFLIVIILQVHYFHTPFLHLSAQDRFRKEEEAEASSRYRNWVESWGQILTSDVEAEEDERTISRQDVSPFKLWLARTRILVRIVDLWEAFTTLLWRLAEIHVFKLVVVIVMFVALKEDEVSALTAVYVILVALLLPFVLTKAHLILSNLVVIWTCLVILAKMLYQLSLVPRDESEVCDKLNATGPLPPKGMDNFVWMGFRKIEDTGETIDYYIRLYILVLMVVLFESIVRYHQRQHFNHPDHPKMKDGIFFPNIHREHADKGIIECIKFFANYAFYKFGLEICYVTTAVTVCIRMDIFGVIYTVLLAVMMLFSRGTSARIWWLYMLVLAILLPIQFLASLGFPPIACVVYPWHNATHFNSLLERWLYLPDAMQSPPTSVLLGDVLQLLFVSLQWQVFRLELANRNQECNGGDNNEILPEVEANMKIPVGDFTVTTASYLDVCKQAIFEYMFWVTLAVVFITGATRINVFGLGYVIAVFLFMWYGKEFLLKPLRKLLRLWNFLIAYVVFVLFAKACLQLVGCVYISDLFAANSCWVIQLFGINCLLPNNRNIIADAQAENCIIVEDNTGLTWDVVCFAFLLLQRRIYSCHYFRHIVDLLEAQSRLSSRGAELINRILLREVERQKQQESQILVNIKKKMKFLKERQAALRKDFQEPTEHFQAIRGGDYYLFEEGAEEVLEKTPGERVPDSLTFGRDEHDEDKRMGPLQVINTAIDHGAEAAVDQVKQQDEPQGATAEPVKSDDTVDKEDEDGEKAKTWGSFFVTLVGSVADWLIHLCNSISRNYRLVAHKLEGELRLEKEKIKQEKMSEPKTIERRASSEEENVDGTTAMSDPADLIEVTVESAEPDERVCLSRSMQSLDDLEAKAEDQEREFEKSQPRPYRLAVAVISMLISRSELLCYFLMILDQMVYGSLLSLPLPFMVFLWGMLSVPRPSKTFWITVITYTEAVVVTKYLFQFGFFPWNDGTVQESPFYPPRILGIEQKNNYANVDIALLLALFIHRSILKKYGLWKDSKDITEDMNRAGEQEQQPAIEGSDVDDRNPDGSPDEIKVLEESQEEEEEPGRFKKSVQSAVAPFVTFFKDMAGSKFNATVDVYAPMFCCDFINFFIVVFGYQSFGPAQESGDGDVTSYISENRVPIPFLIMLLTQFVLIVIDRALFLRKNVMGKCIFQILLVILIHIWMFFVLPKVTSRSFFDNIPAQLWYFVKCVYFALSAYQIRCGYPTRILGNFLTKKYNYLNLFAFKGFLAVPFLLELRALMDWIWTDSTLAIGSWLQMEDIYANIFILKCWRHSESAYPTPRAQKKKAAIKYGVGGLLLFVIILIIWFPLVIFAFANTVFEPNPPTELTVQIQLGAYQPLFKMTVQQNIEQIADSNFSALKDHFSRDRAAVSFLNRFEREDISVITFNGESTAIWGISEPAQQEMIETLAKQDSLKLEFSVNIIRSSESKASDTLTAYFEAEVTEMLKLAEVINGTRNDTVRVNDVFPRFMQLSTKGITAAKPLIEGPNGFGLNNLTLGLSGDGGVGSLNQYWSIEEEIYGRSHFILQKIPGTESFRGNIMLVTFNDRKAPSTLSFLSGYGIIGLYVSFILLIGRFLRMATTGQYLTIIFRELPMVDNILQLCLDLYLVREMKEFHLEEDLYAKLIFLYRSPETMIKWTRSKPKTD